MNRVPAVVVLMAIYALALGSVHPLDLAVGAVVSTVAVVVLRVDPETPPAGELLRRMAAAPAFAVAVALHVVRGTVAVAALTLGLRTPRAGIVAIPLQERSRTGAAVGAFALTLSPGEVLITVEWESERMLVHTIDAGDPEAVRKRHERLYERYQRKVFP